MSVVTSNVIDVTYQIRGNPLTWLSDVSEYREYNYASVVRLGSK